MRDTAPPSPGTACPLRRVLLRLVLAAAVLLPLSAFHGAALVESCLPAYRVVFGQLAGEFRIQSLNLDREGADQVVRARVALRPVLVVAGKVIYPDSRGTANSSTLIAHALHGPILALLTVLAWPARRWREIGWRLLALAPLLSLLVLTDVPAVLAAELWEILIEHLAPNTFSPLVIWKNFLQGGGRNALGVAIGAASVALAARIARPRPSEADW
jgi:hypothetical protein